MRQTHRLAGKRVYGFTLIELMVTVLVVAILASIAVPAYQSQIRRSRRTEGKNAVLDLATREERYLSIQNQYTTTPASLGYSGTFPVTVGAGYYTLTVTVPDPAQATATSYIITATVTGLQVKDTACKTFSVNQLGQQTATDSTGAAVTTGCW